MKKHGSDHRKDAGNGAAKPPFTRQSGEKKASKRGKRTQRQAQQPAEFQSAGRTRRTKAMKRTNKPHNRAGNRVPAGNGLAFTAWLVICARLSAIGAVRRKLEGFRLHLDRSYYELLTGSDVDDWIGWSVGSRCCRLAPRVARHLFDKDRERAETALGADMGGSATGDEPVEMAVRSHGRIHLRDQLTTATGITKNGEVMVVPRKDVLEVWDLVRWTDLCDRADQTVDKVATGGRDAIPVVSSLSRGNPICSDPRPRQV